MHLYKRQLYHSYRFYTSLRRRLKRRVTQVAWLMLGGMFVAALMGLDTNLSSSYQTFTLLFCILLIASIAVFFHRSKFAVERVMPRFGSAQEKMRYKIVLRNLSSRPQRNLSVIDETADPRPSFIEFLKTPEPGEESRNWYDRSNGWYRWLWLVEKNTQAHIEEHVVPLIAPNDTTELSVELTPLKRGYMRLDSTTVACPDPFGLFRSLRKIPAPQSILILPKRYVLPPVDLPGRMKYQQGGVAMASSVGESEEFVSLRDYRAGDPLRHIHWKSWAKIGKPIVKEFQDEFFVRHALILDTFAPTLHSEVFEEAVSVAASFAYTIQTQDSLLDMLFVGPQAYCFTAGRGLAHAEQMLEVLACVQACQDKPFAALKQLVIEHLSSVSGCICILVAWDEERQKFIRLLRGMGIPVLVFVIVPSGKKDEVKAGPMSDQPENFHVLEIGKIKEVLASL